MIEAISQFHFLRPLWLLAFIPLVFVVRYLLRYQASQSSWTQVLDPKLLPHLLPQQKTQQASWPAYCVGLVVGLLILAIAGPVWEKRPMPAHQDQAALVVVLDLSLSMQATDVKPSRLVKAQHKLQDLMASRQQGLTGLVVYAGAAHRVVPLTYDTQTIISLLPSLSPLDMPAMGSEPGLGIENAISLFEQSKIVSGQILWLTDGVDSRVQNDVIRLLRNSSHQLSILSVGTTQGSPIPLPQQGFLKDRGDIVIAKTEPALLQAIAQATNGRFHKLTLNNTDLDYLLQKPSLVGAQNRIEATEREYDQWYEAGPWLILVALPFLALCFRRGWLFAVVLCLQLPVLPEAEASLWRDLWQTPDQQGSQAYQEQDYDKAATLFEDPLWQGSASYRQGDYAAAAEAFSQSDSPLAHFNRGNALAQLGQLDDAISAYDRVLALDPQHADALANKALLEALKQAQKQEAQEQQAQNSEEQNQQGDPNNQDNASQSESGNSQQGSESGSNTSGQTNNSDSPSNSNEQATADQQSQDAANSGSSAQNDEQGQNGADTENDEQQKQSAEQLAQKQSAEETEKDDSKSQNAQTAQASDLANLSEEEKQALEQWLRRIPDDPSGLMRRKFNYEYQQRRRDNQYLPPQDDRPKW